MADVNGEIMYPFQNYFAKILFRRKYIWYQLIYNEETLAPVRRVLTWSDLRLDSCCV